MPTAFHVASRNGYNEFCEESDAGRKKAACFQFATRESDEGFRERRFEVN